MAQEKAATPEKQLLKLIEQPKGRGAAQAAAAKRFGLSIFSIGALKARLSFLRNSFKGRGGARAGVFYWIDIRTINRVMEAAALFLALYFAINLGYLSMGTNTRLNSLDIKTEKGRQPLTEPITSFSKSISQYLEKARSRDIFKMGYKKATAVSEDKPASSRIIEATKHLKLVGIAWSNDPDAMIEDTKALRTIFAKRGQQIGNVKVQAIFKDKIILNLEGEEIELK